MTQQVFTYILHSGSQIDDTALELLSAAKKFAPEAPVTAIVAGNGDSLDSVCNDVTASYSEVWKIDDAAVSYPNAELIRGMLSRILPPEAVIFIPHEHFGMDLAPGLAVKLDSVYVSDVIDFNMQSDGQMMAVREEYSGQVSTHVLCDVSAGAVINCRPGSFKADESQAGNGQVIDKTADALNGGVPGSNRRYLELVEAEVGDVDITKADVLVSVGRGIEDEDNIEIVFDLAKAMGAEVSCSRPIVDAKWLEKPRQVGTSGKTVKPKVYLALGISGSFQHLGGVKGNPYIVAVNKNSKAPIFQVADIGVVADIIDFVPELTDKISAG